MEELFNNPDRLWIANRLDSDDLVCFHNSCLTYVLDTHELPYMLDDDEIYIDNDTIRPILDNEPCVNIFKCEYKINSELKELLLDFASKNVAFNILKPEEEGGEHIITCGDVPKFVGPGKIAHVNNIIMCFAVFVLHYSGDGKLDGVIAGHFVTPQMVSEDMSKLLPPGKTFVSNIIFLMTQKGWEWDFNTELQIWLNGSAKANNNKLWDQYVPAAMTLQLALGNRQSETTVIKFTTEEMGWKEVSIDVPS